jgi:hypothetical protein
VPKDKKKKPKGKKDKKATSGIALSKAPKAVKKASKSLQALTQNPLVADVVAAALVSMAAALKDSDKARRLASEATDELSALSKKAAKDGNAMWDLALDIGRRTLHSLTDTDENRRPRGKSR